MMRKKPFSPQYLGGQDGPFLGEFGNYGMDGFWSKMILQTIYRQSWMVGYVQWLMFNLSNISAPLK